MLDFAEMILLFSSSTQTERGDACDVLGVLLDAGNFVANTTNKASALIGLLSTAKDRP